MTRWQRHHFPQGLLWLLVIAFWTTWAPVAHGKFFRFVDEAGRVHYVDDLSKVPPHQMERLEQYSEPYDHLTPAEREERMRVGPVLARDITVLIIANDGPPVPFDGLLGMNFLRSVTYSVDYRNQVIHWQQ